ncbi:MAG: peptidoglycan editing factor PgeF [Chlorobiaceae bacterium]|nr:peptidoglycan editing factor PgeF [Chlorobiaceae bacterium]NTW62590.1 peptidoglycan editing factor PgeF [Chlorobiaceae bacterium]
MQKKPGNRPEYLVPALFSGFSNLVAVQSLRTGGTSLPPYDSLNFGAATGDNPALINNNIALLCEALAIEPRQLAWSDQVHGTSILEVSAPGAYHGYDALITRVTNIYLSVFTADCYPVLIFDPVQLAVGSVHAGWKGTSGEIVMKTVALMQRRFNTLPAHCLAYIGTGISQRAYEVSRDTSQQFPESCSIASPKGDNTFLLDLAQANHDQLLASGISAMNIERSPFCTFDNADLFFSYRRDAGKTGRMISLTGIRG